MSPRPPRVEDLAQLARIALPPGEADRVRGEIAAVTRFLARVRGAGEAGAERPAPVRLAPDEPAEPLPRSAALAAAPDPAPPFFGVPPFVDEG